MTSPEVERTICFVIDVVVSRVADSVGAYFLHSLCEVVGWEALESSSAVLQTTAKPSQLPAQIALRWEFALSNDPKIKARKKARCLRDTEPSKLKAIAKRVSQSGLKALIRKDHGIIQIPGFPGGMNALMYLFESIGLNIR